MDDRCRAGALASAEMSFVKRGAGGSRHALGTRRSAHSQQVLVSTGVPGLDAALGGGMPLGSLCLLQTDALTGYARVLARYLVAEALACGHAVLWCCTDMQEQDAEREMMQQLPYRVEKQQAAPAKQPAVPVGDLRIAWQYGKYAGAAAAASAAASAGADSGYCHAFDLSRSADAGVWGGAREAGRAAVLAAPATGSEDERLADLLQQIQQRITGVREQHGARTVVRVVVAPVASPLSVSGHSAARFTHRLRGVLRNTLSIGVLLLHPDAVREARTLAAMQHLADTVLRVESFAEQGTVVADLSGVLHVLRVPRINTLQTTVLAAKALALKLRRRALHVEPLSLPPELGEAPSREL